MLFGACALLTLLFVACGGGGGNDAGNNGGTGDSSGDDGGDDGGNGGAIKTYTYPASNLFGLPGYTVEIPQVATDPFIGTADPKLFAFPNSSGRPYSLVIKEAPKADVPDVVFIEEIPGDANECQYSETGTQTTAQGDWRLFEFSCSNPADGNNVGVAAETVINDYATAIIIYSADDPGVEFLGPAVDSFTPLAE